MSFAKSVLQRTVWPIVRNILLPSRHKNTDLGAVPFQNELSIKLLSLAMLPNRLPCSGGTRNIIDPGTATGIYDLRRLKIKHCAEPVEETRSVLDFCLPSPKTSTLDFLTHFITQNVQVTQKPGSDEFCKIGPAAACMADYPEHSAPKSPQKHRLGSIGFQKKASLQACKGIFPKYIAPR